MTTPETSYFKYEKKSYLPFFNIFVEMGPDMLSIKPVSHIK